MKKLPAQCTGILLSLYPVIAILSTIAKVMMPEWEGHALLSHESIRHLAANIVNDMASPLVIYMLMSAIIVGNMFYFIKYFQELNNVSRKKITMYLLAEAIVFTVIVYLIACQTHAPLRGIEGNILSERFVTLLPFLILLAGIIMSTTCVCLITQIKSWTECYGVITKQLIRFTPWIIPLLLTLHIVATILYVLGK